NVTSMPACTICAPAYPPTAPAPTIAIFWPMASPTLSLAEPSAPTALITMVECEPPDRIDDPAALFVCHFLSFSQHSMAQAPSLRTYAERRFPLALMVERDQRWAFPKQLDRLQSERE